MKRKLSLQFKLITILLIAAIVPLVFISIIALTNATGALNKAEIQKLEAVRDIKKTQVERYFLDIKNQLTVLAQTTDIRNAVADLIQYHNEMKIQGDANFDDSSAGEGLTKTYKQIHDILHPFIGDFTKGYEHYDVFIICAAHGHVMYTYAKEKDYLENLTYGKYRDTHLAGVWKDIVTKDGYHMTDLEKYAPSDNEPAMFMGQPIKINGVIRAALIVQVHTGRTNQIMQEAAGMGRTGETFLVGSDGLLRSDFRSFQKKNEADTEILKRDVHSVMADLALGGKTGSIAAKNYKGVPVLSAYTPVKVDEYRWGLVADIDEKEAFAAVNNLIFWTVIIASFVVLLFAVIGIFFALSISKPINQYTETLRNSSSQIALASNQLSSSSQEIANGATEQASSIEETTSSMEELASMVKQNAGNAKEASNLSEKARDASQTGFNKMEQMMDSMSEINKSSGEIRKIIDVIDNIAFQTNILALNAAVEAARAGEAGMGFAVVADEVKNLANRSAEAAKETAGLIEESIRRTEAGLTITTELSSGFEIILTNIRKVADMVNEVEAASRQQDTGINQVNKAIVQLDEVVQANASSSEEAASSAEEMSSQAETLRSIVAQLSFLVTGRIDESEHMDRKEMRQIEHNATGVNIHRGKGSINKTVRKAVQAKEVSPEKLIPFEEDEEFSDIS